MFSNFSWLQYGIMTVLSLVIYYAVVLLLYYRQEMRALLTAVVGKAGKIKNRNLIAAEKEVPGVLGKALPEEGVSSVSFDELDFGRDPDRDQLVQDDLADCMEEFNFTISLAKEKSWDKGKLTKSLLEIGEAYSEVFQSKLRPQVLEHISLECGEKLDWEISTEELENLFAVKLPAFPGKIIAAGAAVFAFMLQVAQAQDGNQGISEATNKVKGYFDTGTSLMYAIGAIMGLVGAVKVYSKWNAGEPDTTKVATAWFGSCIFLVVVATVLKSFFGI
ncbi:protein of unknown function [Pedobacter westerhofensis]|uniref:Uncharacterized protein n=1 Tax=Pedobacter westerhofensis TaxID=425512 RepID=A0A521DPB8_9SPHI|nr:protein of unknown function [Pedobacter westerhofensis]